MEKLLERFGQADQDPVRLWSALVDKLRPARPTEADTAAGNLRELGNLLARRPDLLANLRKAVLELFAGRKQVTMYVSSGLLPSTGFFSETSRRFGSRMLPELLDTAHLKDLLSAVFHRVDDEEWVRAIPDEDWQDFLRLLVGHQTPMFEEDASPLPSAVGEILESLRVLSFHVSAIGLDRELVRIDPHLEEHESPFLAQNAELLAYIGHYKEWWTTPGALIADDKHLTVMLHQCDEVLQRVRKRAMRVGTSLTLTFKLERLRQAGGLADHGVGPGRGRHQRARGHGAFGRLLRHTLHRHRRPRDARGAAHPRGLASRRRGQHGRRHREPQPRGTLGRRPRPGRGPAARADRRPGGSAGARARPAARVRQRRGALSAAARGRRGWTGSHALLAAHLPPPLTASTPWEPAPRACGSHFCQRVNQKATARIFSPCSRRKGV